MKHVRNIIFFICESFLCGFNSFSNINDIFANNELKNGVI